MTKRLKATPSLAIIDALDRLAGQVRKNHADVPDNIVLVLASGKTGRGAKHGHFAPGAWKDNMHEILISAESIARGPEATLGTLIHELAHATAAANGIRDTSNNNRYHNKRFKEIGESMGIQLEAAPTLGWSLTTLPEQTAEKYATGLEALEKSITTYRMGLSIATVLPPVSTKPRNKTKAPMVCGCNDEVTVSIQWFQRSAPMCQTCGTEYTMVL